MALKKKLEDRLRDLTAELNDISSYNRSLLEASLDPLVTIGVDGHIQDVNEATIKATGVPREEMIGSDFSSYFTEPGKAKAGYEKVFAEGVVRDYELSIKHRDGGVMSVLYNASLYRDRDGQVGGVFAAARDITDRLMAERAFARNTAILDEAGRMAKVGGWELDLTTMELLWTEATYAIHEIATDYKPTLESGLGFYAPESVAIISKAVQGAIEEGHPFDEELELITAKQNRIWVRAVGKGYLENGKIARISGIFQDITARKKAESLKAIQGELAQILSGKIDLMDAFSALLDAAIQLSGMDCGGVYAMDEQTGCLDLVITKNLSADFIRNSSHYEASTPNAAILMTGGPIYTTHSNLGNWNTGPSDLGALAILPLVASGTVIGCLKVGSFASAEVPEAVREPLETLASRVSMVLARIKSDMAITGLNKELSDKSAELEATNKELEAFSYSVSHDLRAPLRHLTGFVALLEQKGTLGLDEQSKHYLQIISGSARKMGELIDDLLSFSRMGRGEMMKQRVDMMQLSQEVIAEVSKDIPPARTIDWRIGELPTVSGDRAMLRLVLVNLISNAVKYSSQIEAPVIKVDSLRPSEEGCTIFVRDNGVGFNMKYVDKLFGLFQRLHSSEEYEGTGVGLANVRRIIGRHGGRTWAEGELNKGATFYFTLPQDKEIRS
jgi:PAS domain S-box-containing protein